MDDADKAGQYQEREMEALLKSHQQKRQLTPQESADNCEECGLQIPSARQIAVPGCSMCAECAAYFENQNN
ncbi:TraR/DksA C4-type zinc finger protein [Endozoicomonas atrinae]|nr:TraR/DksA C4-type zinc finger protein [Endozoicomonas atrinae]